MKKEFDYIIVGAGLCGLVLAKELCNKNKKVLVLEKGRAVNRLGKVRQGVFFYDRWNTLFGTVQHYPIYRSFGVGGTSLISCGNAVRFSDSQYKQMGLDFRGELEEAKRECFVRDNGLCIGVVSRQIMDSANKLGYAMSPMPKFSITGNCASCGNCIMGCSHGAKWTSAECLKETKKENLSLITNMPVNKVDIKAGKAIGVGGFFAEKVILSAGGLSTPVILQKSGIKAGENLFVDFFDVVYGRKEGSNQIKELPMSVVCSKFHQSDGFVLSPFVDNYVGFLPNVKFSYFPDVLRMKDFMGIMVKIADDDIGRVNKNGSIDKMPTYQDFKKLKKGNDIAAEILMSCGVKKGSVFATKARGAHPGGTAAIGRVVNNNLETPVKNLYACDASVLPFAPGLPPMLSLIALTKHFAKKILL